MTVDDIVNLAQQAMYVTLMAAAPMLLTGMAVGLFVSILQSVTQIQEITLTFVPKIIIVMLSFIFFLPWTADLVLGFVRELLLNLNQIVR